MNATACLRHPWSWPRVCRGLASERRYQAVRDAWAASLAASDTAFLPEAFDPGFLTNPVTSAARDDVDPLRVYWRELRRYPGLSREQEFVLARALDLLQAALLLLLGEAPPAAARALAAVELSPYSPILERLRQHPRPGPDWEPARLARLRQRLHELRQVQQVLIVHTLSAVPAAARRYAHYGVALEDLMQEGNGALLRAVERYDRLEGVRFSHYAQCWIHQGILKALSCQARVVRLPVYLAQILHRVREVQAGAPEPLLAADLAQRSRANPERVERALMADRACISLDRPLGSADDEATTLAEQLADPEAAPEADQPSPETLRLTLGRLLDGLPARESRILRLRYGLDGAPPRTLDEVRNELGVSRERVRQLQEQALRRLQQPRSRHQLARFG